MLLVVVQLTDAAYLIEGVVKLLKMSVCLGRAQSFSRPEPMKLRCVFQFAKPGQKARHVRVNVGDDLGVILRVANRFAITGLGSRRAKVSCYVCHNFLPFLS